MNYIYVLMKSKEVLKFLNITRQTLTKYVKNGTIKVIKLDNGYYDYNEQSVFKFAKKESRLNYIYCRVSTYKQKNDLTNQISFISNYCKNKNINIDSIFSEIASGIDFDRKQFSLLLTDVMNYKVNSIFISNKDRLTRLSFKTLQNIFTKFGTKIIVINDDTYLNESDELLEELINMIHIISTKMYSERRIKFKTIQNNIKIN